MSAVFSLRFLEPELQTNIAILLIDKKYSVTLEIKNKLNNLETVGLGTYSNSKSTTSSFISIFETLWKQIELYQQIKELYQSIIIREKVQRETIYLAAHELRNPIQPIIGFSNILMSNKTNTINDYKDMVNVIVRNAKRLQKITDDILDVAKIENNAFSVAKERFDISVVIAAVIHDFEEEAKRNRDEIEFVSLSNRQKRYEESKSVIINADKHRVVQVISNLLSNAIKSTINGKITVFTEIDDKENSLFVKVKDTGIGIDAQMMPHLFSKFTTTSSQGTGLGLYICKKIIEAHGGSIWAENNADGKGATFSFILPI